MKLSSITSWVQFISVISLSLFLFNTAHAGKLYKWVDAEGRISYQDKPPPQNAKILDEKIIGKKTDKKGTKPNSKLPLRITPVDVYVTGSCVSCDEIVDKLAELNVPHNEKDIENFRDIQSILIRQTNSLTVPAVFIDNKLVRDAKLNTIESILRDHGYLHPEEPEDNALKSEDIISELTDSPEE